MNHTLEVFHGYGVGSLYDLTGEDMVIGRDPKCHIVIPGPSVSRTHARLVPSDGGYSIEDCRSRNRTYVNGREVEGRIPLRDGDRVEICETVLVYRSPVPLARESEDDDSTSVVCSLDAASSTGTAVYTNAQRKLEAILRVTESLGATLDEKAILARILRGLLRVFPQADRGLVLLQDGANLIARAVEGRANSKEDVRYSATLVEKVMAERRAIVCEDPAQDPSLPSTDSITDLRVRSMMCVPLLSRDKGPLGVIQLDSRHSKARFDVDDLHVLSCVAAQVSIFVENTRLHREAVKHARMVKELDFARAVQYSFLPRTTPQLPGYRFWSYYEPARQVGGDFYDFVDLPDGRLVVLLGDAAGKGTPASLVMARVSGLCPAALLRQPDDLPQAMEAVNLAICDSAMEGALVTLAACRIDPATHQAAVSSAGHVSPILCRADGTLEEMADDSVRGYPLGVERRVSCGAAAITLRPGDFVLLFSDGVTDQVDSRGERYSTARLRALVSRMNGKTAEKVGEAVLDDVRHHRDGCEQSDDMSLIVFQRCEDSSAPFCYRSRGR